jgi:hypothetical protein
MIIALYTYLVKIYFLQVILIVLVYSYQGFPVAEVGFLSASIFVVSAASTLS